MARKLLYVANRRQTSLVMMRFCAVLLEPLLLDERSLVVGQEKSMGVALFLRVEADIGYG